MYGISTLATNVLKFPLDSVRIHGCEDLRAMLINTSRRVLIYNYLFKDTMARNEAY